jgi:AraC family transcriptional regulator, regulatory protein of adaptative response / methylated-DNA-[protein]-cysteine methyltransferase
MVAFNEDQILAALAAEVRRQADEGFERLDVDALTAIAPWSRRQMERRFRDRYLTSPARYFRDCQWECARKLLLEGSDVLTASVRASFASPGRLHDAAVVRTGLTPGEIRRRGAGVHVNFGFFETQIGIVMIAATKRGLSSLTLCGANPSVEDLARQVDELAQRLSNAELEENAAELQSYADQLVTYLDARTGAAFCPPLDILEGTTFQREVWAELQRIEPGETITYTELAVRIGKPNAVRAVANACASNNVAIAIPCHRCIRQDGTLAGYRWGVAWKHKLLCIEAERSERDGQPLLFPMNELEQAANQNMAQAV